MLHVMQAEELGEFLGHSSKILGENIQRLLNANGWTQDTLAGRIGISPGQVSRLLRGQTWVSDKILSDIAKVLGVPIGELFRTDGKPEKAEGSTAHRFSLREAIAMINNLGGPFTIKLRAKQKPKKS